MYIYFLVQLTDNFSRNKGGTVPPLFVNFTIQHTLHLLL